MLALFGQIKADVLESDLPFLRLKPQRKLSRDAQIVTVKIGEKPFRLKVRPVERNQDGTWVEILDNLETRQDLKAALQRSLDALEERRVAHRERAVLAVRSPDLPNFRGTTVDISDTGLRLATGGPVEVGVRLRLEIDSREPCERPTDLSGIAVWSAKRGFNDYQVGVRVLHHN